MIALLLLACTAGDGTDKGRDKDGPEGCTGEPAVTIGTGEQTFRPLEGGDEIPIVHGPQGGWHMLGSARVENTGDRVLIEYRIFDVASDELVADNSFYVGLITDDACGGYYPGMFGFLDVSALKDGDCDTPPEVLADHEVRFEMDVEDDDGLTASATEVFIAVPDKKDDPTCVP